MANETITMAQASIHNPSEARHFMRIKPVKARVRASLGSIVLAESSAARRVLEVGRDFYDPVLYFPREDLKIALRKIAGSTHCPLKGDAEYFDAVAQDGTVLASKIAWSYETPFPFSDELRGLVAFYGDRVAFDESPFAQPT